MRAPAGHPEDGEAVDAEAVGELCDVARPVEQSPRGIEVGEPVAGPVDEDEPDAGRAWCVVAHVREPGEARPVEPEHSCAVWRAPLGIAESPSIGEREGPVHGRRTLAVGMRRAALAGRPSRLCCDRFVR